MPRRTQNPPHLGYEPFVRAVHVLAELPEKSRVTADTFAVGGGSTTRALMLSASRYFGLLNKSDIVICERVRRVDAKDMASYQDLIGCYGLQRLDGEVPDSAEAFIGLLGVTSRHQDTDRKAFNLFCTLAEKAGMRRAEVSPSAASAVPRRPPPENPSGAGITFNGHTDHGWFHLNYQGEFGLELPEVQNALIELIRLTRRPAGSGNIPKNNARQTA